MGLKPGQKAPASGQYGVIGPRGGKVNHEVTAVKGKPMPPTQRQIVKDFLIKFTKNLQKGARSTVWLLTPRLIDYIFPFSRSLQRYA